MPLATPEYLRECASDRSQRAAGGHREALRDAADEIEQLRAALKPYFDHWERQAQGHSPQSSIWDTHHTPVSYEHHQNTRILLKD
jgi:hypothetical protein